MKIKVVVGTKRRKAAFGPKCPLFAGCVTQGETLDELMKQFAYEALIDGSLALS